MHSRPRESRLAAVLPLLFLVSSAALPLARRQVTTLAIVWDDAGDAVHRSDDKYLCKPVNFTVKGVAPPFSVDALAANDTSTVLEHVADVTTASALEWTVDLDTEQEIVFRVTDSLGRVELSEGREVKYGPSAGCEKIHKNWWESRTTAQKSGFVAGMMFAGPFVIVVLFYAVVWTCVLFVTCRRRIKTSSAQRRQRRRQQELAKVANRPPPPPAPPALVTAPAPPAPAAVRPPPAAAPAVAIVRPLELERGETADTDVKSLRTLPPRYEDAIMKGRTEEPEGYSVD
ncbi:hypothetical protein JCM10207_002511 [Rhodosporidiobolus poonsookiae]